MPRRIGLLVEDEAGATSIEYGMIASLIALGLITVLDQVGTELFITFGQIALKLASI